MTSSWMLRRVALVRTDVSEELKASFFRVTRIGEEIPSSIVTRRNIPEDAILHSHRRENLKSYKESIILQEALPSISKQNKKPNSVVFSPQANYTDRASATCRRS
jgi:hypothetical protein